MYITYTNNQFTCGHHMPMMISVHVCIDVLCLYVGSMELLVAFYLVCLICWIRGNLVCLHDLLFTSADS